MFDNIFPHDLCQLVMRAFPHHRLQPVMLGLISAKKYAEWLGAISPEERLLTPAELDQLRTYTFPKRQAEWLTGRVCAKLAALKYLETLPERPEPILGVDLEITNDTSGRPLISGKLPAGQTTIDLSITHGKEYGIAIVADCYCGIDIQRNEQTLLRVEKKFCTEEEAARLHRHLPEHDKLQHLTLLWVAKEAVKKTMSAVWMPGFQELVLAGIAAKDVGYVFVFHLDTRDHALPPVRIKAIAGFYEEYGIAACLLKEIPHA